MSAQQLPESVDVVVYGASLAGIMAVQRLAARGLTALVLEPTGHVGGIVAGGLVKSDFPNVSEALAGQTKAFFDAIAAEYGDEAQEYPFDVAIKFEASVAERVATKLLAEAGAQVLVDHRIHGAADVEVRADRVRAVRVRDRWIRTRYVVDASYEGDLMAAAGAPYRFGRESAREYDESFAGFLPDQAFRKEGFSSTSLYPVRRRPDLTAGDADEATQAYNFRGILTTAADRIPFPRPEDYDPALYTYLGDLLEQRGVAGLSSIVTHTAALPHEKFQTNQALYIGFDLPGASWPYPDGDWATRDAVIAEHVRWHQGMLYWFANDPRLPESFRADASRFGLPADEFIDSPHGAGFPHALYIREARRMVGQQVLTQHDLRAPDNIKPTSVCSWKYGIDCHIVQYWGEGEGTIVGEGTPTGTERNAPVDLYDMPAEVLFPARGGLANIVVPLCFSASHVGYLSARMEPNYGMLGEAAGELIAQAAGSGDAAVQDYDYPRLRAALEERGSRVSAHGVAATTATIDSI